MSSFGKDLTGFELENASTIRLLVFRAVADYFAGLNLSSLSFTVFTPRNRQGWLGLK